MKRLEHQQLALRALKFLLALAVLVALLWLSACSYITEPQIAAPYFAQIAGRSMEPTLRDGQRLFVMPYNFDALKPGVIVSFRTRNPDRLVMHRLVFKVGDAWITRGDGNGANDPWPMTRTAFLGVLAVDGLDPAGLR